MLRKENVVLRKLVICFLLLAPAAGFAGAGDDFYEQLYERGMTHFRSGDYNSAFRELHLAGFGFLDQPEKVEATEIYAAVAAIRVGNEALTRAALLRIAHAENIQPHFREITIPDVMRSDLDRAAAALLTNDERKGLDAATQTQTSTASR